MAFTYIVRCADDTLYVGQQSLVYAFVDVAVLAGCGLTLRAGTFVAVSILTKLASAYLGAIAAIR